MIKIEICCTSIDDALTAQKYGASRIELCSELFLGGITPSIGLIESCKNLANNKTRVIVAGLDTDYKGLPFGPMPDIMCEADYLDKLTAICIKCGSDASCTQRISKQTQQVVIGETEFYEARCRKCFNPPKN